MKFITAFLVIFVSTGISMAQDETGDSESVFPQQLTANDLLIYCASSSMTDLGRRRQRYCSGFVSGVEESVRLLGQLQQLPPIHRICVPKGTTARQFVDVYIDYAARKATDMTKPAALVVIEALEDAYACDS